MSVIPATQKAKIRRIQVQSQPRKKVSKTPPISINKKLTVEAQVCHPSYLVSINWRIKVQFGPGKKTLQPLVNKQPKAKRAGDIAQVVECLLSLLSKSKALSSNPSKTKAKNSLSDEYSNNFLRTSNCSTTLCVDFSHE
jgi:hypothetical protein